MDLIMIVADDLADLGGHINFLIQNIEIVEHDFFNYLKNIPDSKCLKRCHLHS